MVTYSVLSQEKVHRPHREFLNQNATVDYLLIDSRSISTRNFDCRGNAKHVKLQTILCKTVLNVANVNR